MGLKYKLTDQNAMNSFYKTEKGGGAGGFNANISQYLNILYTTEADICVKIAYYVNKQTLVYYTI